MAEKPQIYKDFPHLEALNLCLKVQRRLKVMRDYVFIWGRIMERDDYETGELEEEGARAMRVMLADCQADIDRAIETARGKNGKYHSS